MAERDFDTTRARIPSYDASQDRYCPLTHTQKFRRRSNAMKRLSVHTPSAVAEDRSWCAVRPPEKHENLVHGMSCGLCRNHYWLHGLNPS